MFVHVAGESPRKLIVIRLIYDYIRYFSSLKLYILVNLKNIKNFFKYENNKYEYNQFLLYSYTYVSG